MKKKESYWIQFVYYECPVCGRSIDVRYRVYNVPKPEDVLKRHLRVDSYDHCETL